jgi:rhodanese-related sulfurtransferase
MDKYCAGSVCIPYQFANRRFVDGEQVVELEPNTYFMEDVREVFPDKDINLLVMDFDGQSSAIDALEQLYEDGYENIVGVQGGYRNWFKTWDNKLKRRNLGEYQEHSWGQGETSCGIHASGAGFENQDAQSADFWKTF